MRNDDLDLDVQGTAQHIYRLTQRATADPRHKNSLREELMRRHQELSAEHTQRAAGKFWLQLTGLKRLTLVASPALAAVLIFGFILGTLQATGHHDPQAAEAARLTRAMARTVPTLTSWDVALHRNHRNDATSVVWKARLSGKHLVVRGRQTYLRSDNQWFAITADETHARRLFDWQWGFAILPTRLARNEFSLVKERVINGRSLEGIRYVLARTPAQSIVATAWVDPATGLVMRLQRDVMNGHRVLERDWADYRYQRTP
jgi:hypothetical protein